MFLITPWECHPHNGDVQCCVVEGYLPVELGHNVYIIAQLSGAGAMKTAELDRQ